IGDVDNLIAHPGGRDLVRPTDDAWRAQRGFHGSEIRATPWTTVALPGVCPLRPVVAGENDNRIVFNSRVFDRVEDLASRIIHFGQAVGPGAIPRLAVELRIRQGRLVQ